MNDLDLIRRAFAAYYRSPGDDVRSAPSEKHSKVLTVNAMRYVALVHDHAGPDGLLAVYRVRNDGMLKRMKRWPSDALDDALRAAA